MYRKMQMIFCIFIFLFTTHIFADDQETTPMDNKRLESLIKNLDPAFKGSNGQWQFQMSTVMLTVITDESHDRMRVMVPIMEAEKLSPELLYRMMQANFDSALDARYAIAKGILWSTFIHPLGSLSDEEFLLGVGQTINLVSTFGQSFSSGVLNFGGGDSQGLRERELLDEILEKGQAI